MKGEKNNIQESQIDQRKKKHYRRLYRLKIYCVVCTVFIMSVGPFSFD